MESENYAKVVLSFGQLKEVQAQLTAALARAETVEAELLRVRTTGHGAAHELDNIAIECGLGHSPKPGVVAAHVRELKARAEKAEALYAKAWEECGTWRYANGARTESGWTSTRYAGDGKYYADYPNHAADAHDAARKEAGL